MPAWTLATSRASPSRSPRISVEKPARAALHRCCVEGVLWRGDQLEVAARQARVVGLDGFRARVGEPVEDVLRHVDGVAPEDRQGIGGGGRVADAGAGGDHRGLVAGNVGNRVGIDAGRPAGLGQATALDRREVLAHAVHLADGGAGLEQRLVHRLLVRQADAFGRQRKQCGAAAGEKEDHPVALVQAADQFQHATGDALAGVVGHRMGGFHHLDATALRAVAVRRHYQALDLALPVLLHHFGHGSGGLAGTDDDGAPAAIFRQVVGQHLVGMAGCHRGIEQLGEKGAWIGTHDRLRISCCRAAGRTGGRSVVDASIPQHPRRRELGNGSEAPGRRGRESPGRAFASFTPPCGRGRKRAAANTGVRRPFLSPSPSKRGSSLRAG
ncbi:hypothetical protein Ysp71_3925 [Pseudomonas aeruginosa]|nr:hypothetical protein Ysp71_3925 [Pseudomonas aeruginosa]